MELPRVSDHKGHLVGSYVLGCTDEVALILAVCRIEDDDEFAISCVDHGLSAGLVQTRNCTSDKKKQSQRDVRKASIVSSIVSK